ncbi:methionyl-tRNA formyltransferase [Natrinema salsiterrestre]|uniref:Methionyl-tRNA formyltransferase n=1 Tax=Natrinema salsiterrestre TaxID=2950540 RepID=A0A9Q4L1E8_9EURY|nr:methionyl-tRNA formyltransferase [Natrinema salsiterrestre]MDF9745852.1 methionyl-tRNA formyltransferase [Natrinema salsiterrestre]
MRIVFVTHNKLGLACLEELAKLGANIKTVYTQPQREELSDQINFKSFTNEHGIPLHRVETVNDPKTVEEIKSYEPDLLFVVGWSRLVDTEVLAIPSVTALGMHPAPLPRGRGRAPIAWSIIKGLDTTALSFFHLVEEADAGDIVGQEPIPIETEDDATTLYEKVIDAGRELIRKYYPKFTAGEVPRTPQNKEAATWWPKRDPQQGLIDWTRPPEELYNWIRGLTRPYPGAFSYLEGQKITIWSANPPSGDRSFVRPGEIAYCEGGALGVGAWEGIIELTELEISDRGPMSPEALLSNTDFEVGDSFTNIRNRLNK